MLANPFPSGVSFCALSALPEGNALPLELRITADWKAEKRIRQFLLGRLAARRAAAEIDSSYATQAIARGERGEPLWPEGLLGAITHAGNWAAAAVCRTERTSGLGLDLELTEKERPRKLVEKICTALELSWLRESYNSEQSEYWKWFHALFSAKESFYKAAYPSIGGVFGFSELELTWDLERESFWGRVTQGLGPAFPKDSEWKIGVQFTAGYVMTSTLLESREMS